MPRCLIYKGWCLCCFHWQLKAKGIQQRQTTSGFRLLPSSENPPWEQTWRWPCSTWVAWELCCSPRSQPWFPRKPGLQASGSFCQRYSLACFSFPEGELPPLSGARWDLEAPGSDPCLDLRLHISGNHSCLQGRQRCSGQDQPVCWRMFWEMPQANCCWFSKGKFLPQVYFSSWRTQTIFSCLSAVTWQCMSTRHSHTQAKVVAEAGWHTGPWACGLRDTPALLMGWLWGDGSTREEKGPHSILLWYLHPSSIIISITQFSAHRGLAWAQKVPLMMAMDKKKSPY